MWSRKYGWFFILLLFFSIFFSCSEKSEVITLSIKGHKFFVEVAKTPKQRERGLMYRKHLESDRGMLFVFDRDERLTFWMKNTYVPLSIAFLSEDGKILQIEDMKPLSEKIIESQRYARYALELPRGSFKRIGAKVGDYVKLPPNF